MKILLFRLKSIIITALVVLSVVIAVYFTAHSLNEAVSANERIIPIYDVAKDANEIAITFNCAVGNSDIDSILSTLDKYNIKATFFLLGSWANDYTNEVQKIYNAGHELGNHSYSHNDMPSMNYENIILDIQKCNETIRNITGYSPTLFRAPSGSYDNKTISAAESLQMKTIQWNVDSIDWKNISSDEIIDRVTSKIKSGSIIQLHTGTENTAQALPYILDYINLNNFKCVKVSELIYNDNYTIDNNGTQHSLGSL